MAWRSKYRVLKIRDLAFAPGSIYVEETASWFTVFGIETKFIAVRAL